ncbi:MAG TPA: RNA-binding protein [Blastocatellia bacterium]|nr:RNA-binding protein [Blastocatellia bacterium]
MLAKLWVGNLSPDTTGEDLLALFSTIGVVELCQLIEDQETGRFKGVALVVMNSMEAAYLVKEKFNGYDLDGRVLRVKGTKPRTE